jgi:RimJ/RimL family protein N-acetyltransferase
MQNENKISFRRLRVDDLSLLHKWLNEPFVKEWYGRDEASDIDSLVKKYNPRIEGKEPTDCYIVYYENSLFGFIQTYKISDYPDYSLQLNISTEGIAGVDLFIGEQMFVGKGLGSRMLRKFLKEIVFVRGEISACIVDPELKNIRAIKSYEKVGFKHFRTTQVPPEKEEKYLMMLKKEELE